MKFHKSQYAALCSDEKDIALLKGKKVKINEVLPASNANDYEIVYGNGKRIKVREKELKEINPKYLQFNDRDIAIYVPTNEKVFLVQIDYLYGKVEIEHDDGSMQVVDLDCLRVVEEGDKILKEEKEIGITRTQKHRDVIEEIHKTFIKKNADYGNSFGEQYAEYGLLSAVIRLDDKMRRLKQLMKQEAQVKDESIQDTILDLANYAIMTVMELDNK